MGVGKEHGGQGGEVHRWWGGGHQWREGGVGGGKEGNLLRGGR